ncbi:hypothetical protein [Kitasatospora sp. NPDC092286]|uniref:hypothetical protein n=1 Tax=Kitasatospora sp. NPDC092286 TaxID=3364087 RepID=UPI0037F61FD8
MASYFVVLTVRWDPPAEPTDRGDVMAVRSVIATYTGTLSTDDAGGTVGHLFEYAKAEVCASADRDPGEQMFVLHWSATPSDLG